MENLRFRKWGGASLSLVVAVFASVVLAAAPRAAVFSPTTFDLPNGLKVVVIENHRAPIVIQMLWYKIGSADEVTGQSGVAHFLEHLMFKGTKTIPPGQFSKIIARNGGQDNAFTSHDYTGYFQRVASDRLELIMKMEADRMSNLVLTDEQVLPERDVVLEERRSRTENNPASQLYEQSRAALYLNHPYGRPVIGWSEELSKLNRKDALAFYRRYYAPNNAILIVAGDVTPAAVKALAIKYYGSIERREIPPRVRPPEPKHLAARRIELKSPRVRQPTWSKTFVMPPSRTNRANAQALQVLASILGGGSTTRLYRRLVVDQKIAVTAGAWYDSGRLDLTEFTVSGSPKPGIEIREFEKAVLAEVKRVQEKGVTEDELRRAKQTLLSSAIYARDSLGTGPNVIGRALTTGRTIEDVESWPEHVAAVTREQVNKVARDMLRHEASITTILLPKPSS